MCGQRRIHIAPDEMEFGTGLKLEQIANDPKDRSQESASQTRGLKKTQVQTELEFALINQVHTREDLRVEREVHGRNCRSAER